MKKRFLILFLTFFGINIFAQDFNLNIQNFSSIYLNKKYYSEMKIVPSFNYSFEDFGYDFQIKSELLFRFDSENFSHGLFREDKRSVLDIQQLWIQFQKEQVSGFIGYKIFEDRLTDLVSPSDNFSPRDFTNLIGADPIITEKIPSFSTGIKIGEENFLQININLFRPSRLAEGVWKPNLPENFKFSDQKLPENYLQYNIRSGLSMFGFEFYFGFIDGHGYDPDYKISFSQTGINIIPYYERQKIYSFSFSKNILDLIFRFDGGYFIKENGKEDGQYVLALEWIGQENLVLQIQYIGEFNSYSDEFTKYSYRKALNNSLTYYIEKNIDDMQTFKVGLNGSYNISKKDGYLGSSIKKNWNKLSVNVRLNLLYGPNDTFWGSYSKDNNFSFVLSYNL